MRDILDQLLAMSRRDIRVEPDPARMRAGDIPRYVGDASAAARLIGWRPRRAFDETLRDVLASWRTANG